VFDKLLAQMEKYGGFQLNAQQIEALTKAAFKPDPKDGKLHVNKDFVGQDPSVLAQAAGVRIPPQTQILFGETTADHVFVQEEQMMPFIPFIRAKNVDHAIEMALQAEHGYRHTAIIHFPERRHDYKIRPFGGNDNLCRQRAIRSGPGGRVGRRLWQFQHRHATGEGLTTPLTFTRSRRVAIAGAMRMI